MHCWDHRGTRRLSGPGISTSVEFSKPEISPSVISDDSLRLRAFLLEVVPDEHNRDAFCYLLKVSENAGSDPWVVRYFFCSKIEFSEHWKLSVCLNAFTTWWKYARNLCQMQTSSLFIESVKARLPGCFVKVRKDSETWTRDFFSHSFVLWALVQTTGPMQRTQPYF